MQLDGTGNTIVEDIVVFLDLKVNSVCVSRSRNVTFCKETIVELVVGGRERFKKS